LGIGISIYPVAAAAMRVARLALCEPMVASVRIEGNRNLAGRTAYREVSQVPLAGLPQNRRPGESRDPHFSRFVA
jgi:hypothetical protein